MKTERLKELARSNPAVRAMLYPAILARRLFLDRERLIRNEVKRREKEMVRSLGQVLAHDPVLRVEAFDGIFAVDPRSDLFFRLIVWKSYEARLVELCVEHLDEDRDVIDVGANVGFYTVLFAKKIRRKVLAVEPTADALRRLRRNVALNDVAEKVEIFEGAASNRTGTADIKVIEGKEEYSSLGEMEHPSIADEAWVSEKVACATLDELAERRSMSPGFLKIDVEGAEHLVLEGAQNILRSERPIILSELSDFLLRRNGSSAKEVIDGLRAQAYDVFDPQNPLAPPGSQKFGDILCFPEEMQVKLAG